MDHPTNRMDTQVKIIDLLTSTNRDGMGDMIEYLTETDFFRAPASTKFHGCFPGGLAHHSLRVHELLTKWHGKWDLSGPGGFNGTAMPFGNALIVAPLLHDLCKIGLYRGTGYPYSWIKPAQKGHALVSLLRCYKHIKLTTLEEMMIRFHMGFYGLKEYDPKKGEYNIVHPDPSLSKEERYGKSWRNAVHHNSIVKWMYFADEYSTAESRP